MYHESVSSDSAALDLSARGFFVFDAGDRLNCNLVCSRFQALIDAKDINYPRKNIVGSHFLSPKELENFHQNVSAGEGRIPPELYEAGEEKWRGCVAHVSVKEPMLQIPEIISFVLDEETGAAAARYLGGMPKIGHIKIKKSYAGDARVRAYTHLFHKDDNGDKILKTLTYLKNVSPVTGGGFN